MGGSIKLFSVRGIAVKMHVTFPLILIWAAFQFGLASGRGWEGAVFGVLVTLLLFAIVVLHELGHSFVALGYGVPIRQIVLLPIGGVAQMGRMPDTPGQELAVAIAGPAVNLVLGVILVIVAIPLGLPLNARQLISSLSQVGQLDLAAVFTYVFATNIFIAVFNLLPAFPMDGGRVLRALMATWLGPRRATSVAVIVGQILAFLMGFWGFFQGNLFLILIAVFIFFGASQEGQMSQVRRVLSGLRVDQAYTRQSHVLAPDANLGDAIHLTLTSFQSTFAVCDSSGQYLGLLPHKKLVEAMQSHGGDLPVRDVMQTDIEPARPGEELFKVQQRMAESHADTIPVVDGGRFLGLLTAQDINEIYHIAANHPEILNPSAGPRPS
jgi:Zn-dependent protease/CBS domain-containing protein